MNTPDKCPKCGANEYGDRTSTVEYVCGSVRVKGQNEVWDQKPACLCIAALRARVKRLDEAGDRLQRIVGQKGDPQHWVDETECDAAVDGWTQAKEAQP